MKVSAKVKQGRQEATKGRAGPAPGRVMARRRVRGGNHAQLARHERQAEEAAARVAQGDTGVVRILTPAPAASIQVPASAGEPLPSALRGGMESAFGADLGAVRVHRDAAAAAAVRAESAQAFAAGRDIYFAAGTYAPASGAGRELIAHEVAHVLQQTGRHSADGRLQARAIQGAGELQRQAGGATEDFAWTGKQLEGRKRLLDTLKAVHLQGVKEEDKEQMEAFIVRIRARLTKSWGEDLNLARDVQDGQFDKQPREARSFLYDALKFAGLFAGAAYLLERDAQLKTAGFFKQMYEYLREQEGLRWFTQAFWRHPDLQQFWPEPLLGTVRLFLANPRVKIAPLKGLAEFVRDLIAGMSNPKVLRGNEWLLGGTALLVQIDTFRQKAFGNIRRRAWSQSSYEFHRRVAGGVHLWGLQMQNVGKEGKRRDQLNPLYKWLGQQIVALAEPVLAFWRDVAEVQKARGEMMRKMRLSEWLGEVSKHVATAFAGREATIKSAPSVVGLADVFRQQVPALYGLTPQKHLPQAGAFVSARRQAQGALSRYVQGHLEPALHGELYKLTGVSGGDFDRQRAMAYALLISFTDVFMGELYRYSARQLRSADARLAAILRSARLLHFFAGVLGWGDLVQAAEQVVYAETAEAERLALVSDWELQAGTKVERMMEDFPQGIKELQPLTITAIVNLYNLLHGRALIKSLRDILGREEGRLGHPKSRLSERPILARAVERANRAGRPQRWVVTDFDVTLKRTGETDIFHLVEAHPKTAALRKQLRTGVRANWDLLYPYRPLKGEPFLWFVPNVYEMLQPLRDSAALNRQIVAALGKPESYVEELRKPERLSEWLAGLAKLKDPVRAVEAVITQEFKRQREELDPLLRRATTQNRRILATKRFAKLLAIYEKNRLRGWSIPTRLLGDIRRFAETVQPAGDEAIQKAALILELGPELKAALDGVTRYDVVTGYLGLLLLALDLAKKNVAQFDAVLQADQRPAATWVPPRQRAVEALAEQFKQAREKSRRRFGIRSSDGRTLQSMVLKHTFKPGEAVFYIDYVPHALVKVYRSFTYHPEYGMRPAPGQSAVETAYAPPLFLDGEGKKPLTTVPGAEVKLFQLKIGAEFKDVTTGDAVLLRRLSRAMESAAFQASMKNLGYLIEKGAEFVADVAELIPVYGQVWAAARTVKSIVEFITGPGFKEMKKMLVEMPQQVRALLTQELDELLTFERLWMYLLFGGSGFKRISSKVAEAKKEQKPSHRRRGKFAKLLEIGRMVWRSLSKLVEGFGRVRQRVSAKFRGWQSFVVTRPRLAAAVRFVADFMGRVRVPTNVQELAEEFRTMQAQFTARLSGMLQALQNFQLPTKIVEIADVIQIVLSTVVLKVIPGAKAKIVAKVLQFLGGDALIAQGIASQIVGTEGDPNVLWQRHVLPPIRSRVTAIRDELSKRLYGLFDRVPFLKGAIKPPPALEPIVVAQEEEAFPEAAPLPAAHPVQLAAPVHLRPPGAGVALPLPMRTSAETRFGHDFGHVRLHTGADALPPTAAFSAEGLTTGSHVYLRPGLSPAFGRGVRVLDHELAHVLQQAGPRPLGGEHSSSPRLGRPERGLRFDPLEETRADQIARAVRGSSGSGPISIERAGAGGFQPDADDVLKRMLLELSSLEAAEKRKGEIEEAVKVGKKPDDLDAEVGRVAGEIWKAIAHKSARRENLSFLEEVKKDIDNYLWGEKRAEIIEKAIPFLARDAQLKKMVRTGRKLGKGQGSGKKKDKVVGYTLDERSFLSRLEAHILASRGIGVRIGGEIKVKEKKGGGGLEVSTKNVKLTYYYVYLPVVDSARLNIWAVAVKNTWSDSELGASDAEKTKKRDRIRRQIVLLMKTAYLMSPDVWERRKYKFTDEFKQEVDELVLAASSKPSPAAFLQKFPAWGTYIKAQGSETPGFDHIGLRIGQHGDKSQKGYERESHHTTQYLLVEYFRNKKEKLPFFQGIEYGRPGYGLVWGSDNTPDSFKYGGNEVKIAHLEDKHGIRDRGGRMPAILIAATSHRIRALHVTSREDEPSDKKTQSNSIHREFKEHLPADLKPKSTAAETKQGVEKYKGEHGAQTVEQQVYTATQKTYTWMHEQMESGFKSHVPAAEKKYYDDTAEEKYKASNQSVPVTYRASLSDLNAIAKKAFEHNDKEMKKSGWVGA